MSWSKLALGAQVDSTVVLDQEPGEEIIGYVEDTLGMFLVWLDGEEFKTGTRTRGVLGPVLGGPIDLETYE